MGVLEEIRGETGGLLWRSLRTVTLWAAVAPSDRADLFAPGAEEQRLADLLAISPEPALEEPLALLAGLLGRPEAARADLVALACTRIAQWANVRGARATELEFAQAAAASCPGDPRLALAVGRAARDRAEYARAETWLHRTIALARQVGDWDSYSRAYIALGKMFVARGAFPNARKNLQKALRAAERRGLRNPQGMALHDLFTVEAECHNAEVAQEYAGRALRAYGPGHNLLPSLAHDVARFWLENGHFADALPVLRAAVPRMEAVHQPYGQAGLARAAGAIGDEATFEGAWRVIWSLTDNTIGKADGLIGAAYGAASLGRWAQAEQAGEAALILSRKRGQSKVMFEAEAVLESVQMERRASTSKVQIEPVSTALNGVPNSTVILAQQFVQSLEASVAV
jgi:tetratricopeptide (TPR) repeat protein